MRAEIKNLRDVWWEGYQRLLVKAEAAGAVGSRSTTHERRQHPRFPIRSEDVSTSAEGVLTVRDMSLSGLAFETGVHYEADRRLLVALAGVFSTETDILACDRLPEDSPEGSPRYRVRCRFRDEEHGLQFLTLALELENLEQA